jgi:hypothetical protein
VQQDGEVAIHRLAGARARVNDEEAHHPEGHLQRLVGVRMVHERAVLPQRELVSVRLARLDVRLVEARDAIHAVRQEHAVPVHAGALGQVVRDQDAHAVALDRLDRRPRALPVVAPSVDLTPSARPGNVHSTGCNGSERAPKRSRK